MARVGENEDPPPVPRGSSKRRSALNPCKPIVWGVRSISAEPMADEDEESSGAIRRAIELSRSPVTRHARVKRTGKSSSRRPRQRNGGS